VLGAAWLGWDNWPAELDRSAAAKIPFDRKERPTMLGEVTAGPGAERLEPTAVLGEKVQAWLIAGDEGAVDAIVVGNQSRRARNVAVQPGKLAKVPGFGRAWPWARLDDGALAAVTGSGVAAAKAKGKRRVLYPLGWLDDPIIVDLAAGPDQSVLATTRATEEGHLRIRRINRDRTAELLVHDAREPALSPNGKRLAFVQLLDERWQIVVAPVNDLTDRALMTRGKGHTAFPTWSPDGKRLAFLTRTVRDDTYFNKRYGQAHLWVTNREGEAIALTAGVSLVMSPPLWTADGIWVLARAMGKADTVTTVWRVTPK